MRSIKLSLLITLMFIINIGNSFSNVYLYCSFFDKKQNKWTVRSDYNLAKGEWITLQESDNYSRSGENEDSKTPSRPFKVGGSAYLINDLTTRQEITKACKQTIQNHNSGGVDAQFIEARVAESTYIGYLGRTLPIVYKNQAAFNLTRLDCSNLGIKMNRPFLKLAEAFSDSSSNSEREDINVEEFETSLDKFSDETIRRLSLQRNSETGSYTYADLIPYAKISDLSYKLKNFQDRNRQVFDTEAKKIKFANQILDDWIGNENKRFKVIKYDEQSNESTASVAVHDTLKNELIISYKGTNPRQVSDLYADGTMILPSSVPGTTIQSYKKNALRFFDSAIKEFRADQSLSDQAIVNVKTTGHSLGGYLGQYVAARKQVPGRVFSSPALHQVGDKNDRTADILNIYRKGDPIVEYTSFWSFHDENMVILPSHEESSFKGHKLGGIIEQLKRNVQPTNIDLNKKISTHEGVAHWVDTDDIKAEVIAEEERDFIESYDFVEDI